MEINTEISHVKPRLGEQEPSPKVLDTHLENAFLALDRLEQTQYSEEREAVKKLLDQVYDCFKKMANSEKRASLLAYCQLMLRISAFIQSPEFVNNLANFDKSLKNNLVKRCLLRPFRQNLIGMDDVDDASSSSSSTAPNYPLASILELELFGEELLQAVKCLNQMFVLIKADMTEFQREQL